MESVCDALVSLMRNHIVIYGNVQHIDVHLRDVAHLADDPMGLGCLNQEGSKMSEKKRLQFAAEYKVESVKLKEESGRSLQSGSRNWASAPISSEAGAMKS